LSTAGKDTNFLQNRSLKIGSELKVFNDPIVMGILNLTPDSFFDGGEYNSNTVILKKASQMIEDGADIIDMGAYSSRPGAKNIPQEEEEKRLLNSLNSIRNEFPEIIISIDTFRSGVAKKSIDLGANIINDISGGMLDDKMMETVASLKVPYILMHMMGDPQNMQINPTYTNVVKDLQAFFTKQLSKAESIGIRDVIIDPGFGFGKSLEDNYRLMKSLGEFKKLNSMILIGISRKSMVNAVLQSKPDQSLTGTIALNTIALLNGADILRVHDIKEAKEAIKIVSYYQNT